VSMIIDLSRAVDRFAPRNSISGNQSRYRNSPPPEIVKHSNATFLNAVLGNPSRAHFVSRTDLHQAVSNVGDEFDFPSEPITASLFVQATHQAFAEHANLSLGPDELWYMIMGEVATLVKGSPDKYAALFAGDPAKKQLIRVRDDSLVYGGHNDWLRSINLIRPLLCERMAEYALQLFMPTFSTSTPESETAILVTFMDVVSEYFEYRWSTMCGIPFIRLEGEAADWTKLAAQVGVLAEVFTELRPYFDDLLPILREIARTASGGRIDEQFWCSIYKYNTSSGGDEISGWITAFFAFNQKPGGPPTLKRRFDWRYVTEYGGNSADQFPTHVSKVPFVWEFPGREYRMAFAAGIFGVDFDAGFLAPRLGFGVYEL